MADVAIEPKVQRAIARAERIYGALTVRCEPCGHNWTHKDGNDLHCRFCAGDGKPVLVGSMIVLVP